MILLQGLWTFALAALVLSLAGVVSMVAARLMKRWRDRRWSATRARLLTELTQPAASPAAITILLQTAAREGSLAGILLQVDGMVRGAMRDRYFERLAQSGAVALLTRLAARGDTLRRVRAIEALSIFRGEAVGSALKLQWQARSAKVRFAALYASIGSGEGPAFEDALTRAVSAKGEETQLAAGLLRRLAAGRPREALFWLDRIDLSPRLAKSLVDGLGDAAADAESVAVLSRMATRHGDDEVRAGAVSALSRLRSPQGLAALHAALEDTAWIVRVRAAVAIGKMRDEGARPLLMRLLDDPNWWVAQRAREALGQLAEAS